MITRTAILYFLLQATVLQADPLEFGAASPLQDIGEAEELMIEEFGARETFSTQSSAIELLGSEFSRAAAQGLIEAQETPRQTSIADVSTSLEERSNLSVTTGIDRDLSVISNVPPTASGGVCLPDRSVNLNEWGDAYDSSLLGKLRSQLIAENGEITPNGALKLARFYIVLGFGSEAKSLLPYIQNISDREIITALAEILDSGKTDTEIFQGQIFCDGAVSLWATLAYPISDAEVPRNTSHILVTFSGLPVHLRSHLGPLLAGRLRDAGLVDEARTALNAVTRSGIQNVESTLIEAKMGLTSTRPELARTQLLELASGTGIPAAEALLELLRDADRSEVPPSISWVDDVPSLVRATKGTRVAADLNLAGLNGMIWLQRFDEVRLGLVEGGPGLTDATRQDLAVQALTSAAEHASDEEFLRSAIGFEKFSQYDAFGRSQRLKIAERLADLGLSRRAASYLPLRPETIEERRIASRVLSANGQTAQAVAVIEESSDGLLPELAEMHVKQGNIDQALSSLAQGGRDEAATLLAIQSGNWDWVIQNGLNMASKASQSLLDPPDLEAGGPTNGPLLEHTQNRRQQARELLDMLESEEISSAFTN